MSAIDPAAVVHRPEDSCFEVVLGDERALCVYRRDGGVVSLGGVNFKYPPGIPKPDIQFRYRKQ